MKQGAYLTGAALVAAAVSSAYAPACAADEAGGWTPATSQTWTSGWDNFNEPLDFSKSKVVWSLKSNVLTITYTLVAANPAKLYQVGLTYFCDLGKVPKKWGR